MQPNISSEERIDERIEPGAEPPAARIREELERVLQSPEFRAPSRRRGLLRYLVEEAIAGRGGELKGYSIGLAVFDRGKDFDPQADPVVRLEARRLRRDLDSYYVGAGSGNPLRISIPKGHYAPRICSRNENINMSAGTPPVPAEAEVPRPPPEDATATAGAAKSLQTRRWLRWTGAAAVLGLLLAALPVYLYLSGRQGPSGNGLSDRGPAVMVLPFQTLGKVPEDTFLAAGISEQIAADLIRFPDFRLYIPPAGNRQEQTAAVIRNSARLGISYVVLGSVRSEASSVNIGVRVVETETRQILWTETYERRLSPSSLLEVQREISARIASTLGQPYGIISSVSFSRLPASFAPSISSYECVLRSYWYRRNFATDLRAPILDCLQKAVLRDPDFSDAWAMLGWLRLDQVRFGNADSVPGDHAYDKAFEAASQAVALDGNNVLALKALSSINYYMGKYDEAEHLARNALALNPNDPDTLAQLGWRLAVRGKFDEGIPYLQMAIERTVSAPGWYYHLIAIDHYMHGRYAAMLAAARSSTVNGSGVSWSLVAIAEAALGHKPAAQRALEKMVKVSPQLGRDPAEVYRRHGAIDSIVDALVAGLRKAGWHEPQPQSGGTPK